MSEDLKAVNVGLLGIGTVGGGTFNVLSRNAEEITRRTGRRIQITHVADRNLETARSVVNGKAQVTDDAFALVNNPDIDVVVELIGGYTIAKELVLKAIANKKHVVTANKALIALHGSSGSPKARAVYVSRWIYCRALAVAQWIVHMPPKRGIQVRFLTARHARARGSACQSCLRLRSTRN